MSNDERQGSPVADPIKAFTNGSRFLSNFHRCTIRWANIEFPSAEHLYQARKTGHVDWARRIAEASTAREAKQLGQQVPLLSNWEDIKVEVMSEVVAQKFIQNPDLNDLLIATGDRLLVEGNSWHDQYWGDCWCPKHQRTPGKNALGIILMRYRLEAGRWQRAHYGEPEGQ